MWSISIHLRLLDATVIVFVIVVNVVVVILPWVGVECAKSTLTTVEVVGGLSLTWEFDNTTWMG